MTKVARSEKIRVAVAGLGNCASSLIEGICYYRQNPGTTLGLLFPSLGGYSVEDIEVVLAFDISSLKVGLSVNKAIYQYPNNFVRNKDVKVDIKAPVLRGPTLDGNPSHLAQMVREATVPPVNVPEVLNKLGVDILVNLLPTGSNEATEYYASSALTAGCAFINCIPTVLAQRNDFQGLYQEKQLPLFGDDIKSQMGTTILHRSLLNLLELRGAKLKKTSQINIGGNTDFANFVFRSETKLISKRKSLQKYIGDAEFHVGHHYDLTRGALKNALIEVEGAVFAGSPFKIELRLRSDDKPNCAGSVVDLIRVAKGALNQHRGGVIFEACAFYMKSPPVEINEVLALDEIRHNWAPSSPSALDTHQVHFRDPPH